MESIAKERVGEPVQRQMPTEKTVWRVGSISMGAALIGMGLSFATSLWKETSAYELLLWLAPIVFIMLGVELLLTIKVNHSGRYQIKYDWLSLWFVGIIGAGALLMSLLFYTGVTDEINAALHMKERSLFIDEQAAQPLDSSVKKVVVKSGIPVAIEEHEKLDAIHLTGNITYQAKDALPIRDQQLMNTKQIGDVLYVFVQDVEHNTSGFVTDNVYHDLVLAVPANITVE